MREEYEAQAAKAFDEVAENGMCDEQGLIRMVAALGGSITSSEMDDAMQDLDPDVTGFVDKSAAVSFVVAHVAGLAEDSRDAGVEDGSAEGKQEEGSPRGAGVSPHGSRGLGSIGSAGEQSVVLAAKNDRKRAEADMQLLANRLAHLRAEEEKARRKIEETRERTTEIASLKAKRAERLRGKAEARRRAREQEEALQAAAARAREEARARRIAARKEAHGAKRGMYGDGRKARMDARKAIEEDRKRQLRENRDRKATVRTAAMEARERRLRAEREERNRLARKYQARMESERQRIEEAGRMIEEMEEKEREMIERLRETQERQRGAYADLEAALQEEG